MSFFIFDRNRDADGIVQALAPRVAGCGVSVSRRVELPAGGLVLYSSSERGVPSFFERDDGHFAALLGTALYRGSSDDSCLPQLLNDHVAGNFDHADMQGVYVLIIGNRGRVEISADEVGSCKLMRDADGDLLSNSFLAMCALSTARTFDPQACYEYVVNGSVFGHRTLVAGIENLPSRTTVIIGESIGYAQRPECIDDRDDYRGTPVAAIVERQIEHLDRVFEPVAKNYGDRLRLSCSGGYDSRLMLAMLLRHGVRPRLFTYGRAGEADVRIARELADIASTTCECIDKSSQQAPTALEPGAVRQDFVAFDGWKVEQPLFDFGIDREDRLRRHDDDALVLNGSLGEIYRNFHYMPDGRSSPGKVISTFYSPYDPAAFTERFDRAAYRAALGEAMTTAIGHDGDTLERWQVERLYSHFRGRYWTGRDAQLNQRFGRMLFPFLEHRAISGTAKVPLGLKNFGILQGLMIERVNPQLANCPSDYGFPLNGRPPFTYRLKTWLGTQRPAALRALSFRLRNRAMQPRGGALAAGKLDAVVDPEFPRMRRLFHLDRLYVAGQFGLVATLEYLGQQFDLGIPD